MIIKKLHKKRSPGEALPPHPGSVSVRRSTRSRRHEQRARDLELGGRVADGVNTDVRAAFALDAIDDRERSVPTLLVDLTGRPRDVRIPRKEPGVELDGIPLVEHRHRSFVLVPKIYISYN